MQKLPTTLTHAIIQQTIRLSPDHGETLDFSHRNLSEVDEEGGRELASSQTDESTNEISVSRIAMSYNRLTALPSSFSLLAKLRYLNLRSNLFGTFPLVLTTLPALEILDLSRNIIKSFPEKAGYLNNLQILSISKNKLTRLPTYLASFQKLNVFKVDHNPVEWPPRDVIDFFADSDEPQALQQRLLHFRDWLEHNSDSGQTLNGVGDAQSNFESSFLDSNASVWSHSRASSYDFLDDGGLGTSSPVYEGFEESQDTSDNAERVDFAAEDTGSSPNSSTHSRSPSFSMHINARAAEVSTPPRPPFGHSSSLSVQRETTRSRSPGIKTKKSLPDLRTVRPNPAGALRSAFTDSPVTPPVVNDFSSNHIGVATEYAHYSNPSIAGFGEHPPDPSISERNAYFKRFSTQTKPPLSKPVSQALVSTVDSVRGIYFAIHQIYEQVDSYTSWTLDERISTILRKILEPAQVQIGQIPIALDKFDSYIAHSSNPPVSVCRRVLESCRENIVVCGKVVAALQLHLKVLAGADDVRFTRSLVLMLYGSMAEIAHAWEDIQPNVQAVKTYLSEMRNGKAPFANGEARVEVKRSRNARRHAGSFSLRDVEIGRSMSTPPPPDILGQEGTSSFAQQQQDYHDGHLETRTSASRTATPAQSSQLTPTTRLLETPDNSAKAIDRELLETISVTVSNAQSLWALLAEYREDAGDSVVLPPKVLGSATNTTSQLTALIKPPQSNAVGASSKQLFEETLSFIKTIAQVLLELKKADSIRPLPASLRATTAKIAQSTKEIAVLLHVSSYSPNTSATPTPYAAEDDASSRTGILRSRSALAHATSSKSPQLDAPRSALPHQRFGL